MLSSRNPHACYLQNLNDDGKLHNGLTASLCSLASLPQKHKLIAKRGEKQHSSNKADSTKCSKCDQHKCQRGMSPTALVTLPLSFPWVQLCFQVSEICIICWKSSWVQTFWINFKHSVFVPPCVRYHWFWNAAHWTLPKDFIMEDILLVAWFIQQHSPE